MKYFLTDRHTCTDRVKNILVIFLLLALINKQTSLLWFESKGFKSSSKWIFLTSQKPQQLTPTMWESNCLCMNAEAETTLKWHEELCIYIVFIDVKLLTARCGSSFATSWIVCRSVSVENNGSGPADRGCIATYHSTIRPTLVNKWSRFFALQGQQFCLMDRLRCL